MLAVTDRFTRALASSHGIWTEVDLVIPGLATIEAVEVVGGSVTLDRTALIRGRASITLPAAGRTPWSVMAGSPLGGEILIRRGVRYPDDTTETVSLGVYRIQGAERSGPLITLTGLDRMAQIADERFAAPRTFFTLSVVSVITTLIQEVYPTVTVTNLVPLAPPIAGNRVYERSRSEAIAQIAESYGADVFFDETGNVVIRPIPTLADAAVWTVAAGEGGVLVDYAESVDRGEVFNAILAVSAPSPEALPVARFVVDADAASPTRYAGPFGKVIKYWTTPVDISGPYLEQIAALILSQYLGLRRVIRLDAVPNPALEPGDALEVVLPDGTSERHLIDSLTVPLGPGGPSTLATRTQAPPQDWGDPNVGTFL